MTMQPFDVVQLEVIRNALVAAAEEMGVTIWRTSRSSVVRDLLDYSTCMFDAEGKSVAQATCIPVHLNSMSSCLDDILRDHIPLGDWREGDIIITNDPYAGGQHLNDILTFKPAFVDGRLVGIAGVLVHHLDVGGGAPGSYYAGATEIYQEGFRIPPMRLDDFGPRNKEVIQLLLRNSREPANVGGDCLAARRARYRRQGIVPHCAPLPAGAACRSLPRHSTPVGVGNAGGYSRHSGRQLHVRGLCRR